MAKQNVALELYYSGSWHNVATDDKVFADAPVTVRCGQGDESTTLRPARITARIDNGADKYRTSNPESPLYGLAGRNTPVRVKVGGTVRGTAEASSWAADETDDFRASPRRGKAWIDLEAGGLLQRISQWSELVSSTMVKGMLSFGSDLVGVWPLEDQSTSTILSELTGLASIGQFTDCTLGDPQRPAGSARSVKLGTTGHMFGTMGRSSASGWQISFAFKLAALPGSATYEEIFSWYDSTGRRWTWEVNNANFAWSVWAADGITLLANVASSYSGTAPNQWIRVKMKATVSGSTVTYEPSWYPEGGTSEVGITSTFSGTSTGYLTRWGVRAFTYNVGAWYTGVFGIDDPTAPLFNTGVIQDFNGHAGETTGARFARLMGDLGLAYTVLGTSAKSAAMGGQPEATFADLLKEIIATEDALCFDDIGAIGLVLMLRDARYSQTPALALTVTDLPSRPREITDDQGTHNVVTASQRDGGQVTAIDSTGPLGTQPPPAGVGEAKQKIDVNVADEAADLPQQANWWLRRGTVNLPRYPQVAIDLNARPDLITDVEAVTVGSVITIDDFREYTVRLHVLGWTETIGTHTRTITFTCAPDQQFDTGEYDDSTHRYDSATTTLSGSLNTTDTLAAFVTTNRNEFWSWTSAPYGVTIAGQANRVLGMSQPDSVAVVDGTFENGIGTWAVTGGTLAVSTAQFHRGGRSALLTVSGSPSSALIRDHSTVAAASGRFYYTEMWVRCSVARDVTAVIDFYNGASYLTSAFTSTPVAANTWTLISASGTAPANTTRLEYGPTMGSSPANGTLLYVDDIEIIRTDAQSGRQLATLTRGINGITKSLPSGSAVHVSNPGRWAL